MKQLTKFKIKLTLNIVFSFIKLHNAFVFVDSNSSTSVTIQNYTNVHMNCFSHKTDTISHTHTHTHTHTHAYIYKIVSFYIYTSVRVPDCLSVRPSITISTNPSTWKPERWNPVAILPPCSPSFSVTHKTDIGNGGKHCPFETIDTYLQFGRHCNPNFR
jgi:hypothetical protein